MDVNIYSTSTEPAIAGNHENTDVGKFLAGYLDLDLASVTHDLREKGARMDAAARAAGRDHGWQGRLPTDTHRLLARDGYHGDFGA